MSTMTENTAIQPKPISKSYFFNLEDDFIPYDDSNQWPGACDEEEYYEKGLHLLD